MTKWDVSPEAIAKVRLSIQPVETDVPLRQVLAEDYPQDCANLPISGGWGYTQADAIVFVLDQFRPGMPVHFVSLEYHIAQKLI